MKRPYRCVMSNSISVSCIVPVYNGGKNWTRVLDALGALVPPPREIIIVDDGSTDDSHRLAVERGFVVLSTLKKNSGPAVARNLGAAHAQGDVLYFVDADVLVYPDAVGRVMAVLADPQWSAVFGTYDDTPDDAGFVSQYKNLFHHFVHQTSSSEATTFWAGCGAIRREKFLQLDGFSTTYTRPLIEDIELGQRVAAAGGKIKLDKELQVKHLKRWTLWSLLLTDIRDRALPWAELIVHQGQLPADLNLKPANRISALLCWLLVLAVAGMLWVPYLWAGVLILILVLVGLNFDLYRFYFSKRGVAFTLRAIPLHWLYYLYSSAAFAYVMLTHALNMKPRPHVTQTAPHQNA